MNKVRGVVVSCGLVFLLINNIFAQSLDNLVLSNVNSEYDEQNPVLSPDGQILYFTRSNDPNNVAGVRDKGDIWVSTLMADHRWSKPENLKKLNNKGYNAVIGFSADGSVIYLQNHYKEEDGIVKTQGISFATKTKSGWTHPTDIMIPYFRNLSEMVGGYITSDEKVLVLSIESFNTKGGEDIYVCLKKDNGKWSDAINLGRSINTKYQEFTPYLSDDKKTLYFSSNGHNGQGSSEVLVATRSGDSWTQWSEPQLLSVINSKGRETGYRIYDGFALYASTINSDGYSDIRMYAEKPIDSIMVKKEVPMGPEFENEEERVVAGPDIRKESNWYGKVTDKETGEPVNAILKIESITDDYSKEVTTNADEGTYALNDAKPGEYNIRIDAPGYISVKEKVAFQTSEAKEENFVLQPISVGTTVHLKNVLFEQSTPNIKSSSYDELNLVVDLLKHNPSMKIRLEGHTDNRGIPKHNLKLSKMRVQSVEAYLVKHGISSKRISGKGYGGSKPIADNDDPELRKLNRRVEFTITKK